MPARPVGGPTHGPSGSSSATPNLAGSLAEVVAMLVECGAVQMTDKSVASTAGDGNGGGQFTAAAAGSHNSTLASDITFESKTALFQK